MRQRLCLPKFAVKFCLNRAYQSHHNAAGGDEHRAEDRMYDFGAGFIFVLFKNRKAEDDFYNKAKLRHGVADGNAVELVGEDEGEVRRGIDNAGNKLLRGVGAEFFDAFSRKNADDRGAEYHAHRLREHGGKAVGVNNAQGIVPNAKTAGADGKGDKTFFRSRLARAGFV